MKKNIFYKHKIENFIVIEKIITVHYYEFAKDFYYPGESHDFWEIVYADKADVICTRDGKEIVLKQGEMIFHKPNEFHAIHADGKKACNVFVITFVAKSKAMEFFNEKQFVLDADLQNYVYKILSEARCTFKLPIFDVDLKRLELQDEPNLGGQQIIRINLEELLIMLIRKHTKMKTSKETFILPNMLMGKIETSIIEYLKENLYKKISLDDLSREFNYGKTFLCTKFKSSTGKTILDYFLRLKIEEAKRLIREKNHTFSQIAELLAFESPAYFSTVFKKINNMSPKEYSQTINH